MPTKNTQFPIDDVRAAVNELLAGEPVVMAQDLADVLSCTTETARVKLNSLVEDGELETRQVGASARIWYLPSPVGLSDESVSGQINPSKDSAPGQKHERVVFFPSRREIVVDTPSKQTRESLARIGHLIDSQSDGYLFGISREDIWTAPYDSFEALRDDIRALVGEVWDEGFESRIRDDWDRAHQFHLRTNTKPNRPFTVLEAEESDVFDSVAKAHLEHNTHYTQFLSEKELRVKRGAEARVKETLYEHGYLVNDERLLTDGEYLNIQLTLDIDLREYQIDWVDQFIQRKAGVFVGPSGSGKTIAAIGVMEAVGGETLIIAPSRELVHQWETELLSKTNLNQDQIGQYHGGVKNVSPVTIATYDTAAMSRHRELFNERSWGLIIADECHHAVASTWKRFREIQSTARLGLSATPVREAGNAKEIYTLIGPPIGSDWAALFEDGWVSKPRVEVRLLPWGSKKARARYDSAEGTEKLIAAARNPSKSQEISRLLQRHSSEKTLIFADWIEQGIELEEHLEIPFVYGETNHSKRQSYFQQFRDGELDNLIVSRIGDEGIDLPDAEVAILASTMGSSKSQTGQRAGRTMRPLGDALVYILLTKGTGEESWGRESTQYLAEKGIDVRKTEVEM